jgi:hypothetical protein
MYSKRCSDMSYASSRHQQYEEIRNDMHWRRWMKMVVCIEKDEWIRWRALKKRDGDGASHPYGGHGYKKICRRRSSPIVVYGEKSARLHQTTLSTIKKYVPSWSGRYLHHLTQVKSARSWFVLDRLSLLPVSCCWELVFMIVVRSIKRALE